MQLEIYGVTLLTPVSLYGHRCLRSYYRIRFVIIFGIFRRWQYHRPALHMAAFVPTVSLFLEIDHLIRYF